MKTGRNDPCPCGSGKKYKTCCLRLDQANRGQPSDAPIREVAARVEFWQADLLPAPIRLDDDPGARPAALLVTAGGFVIFNDILARPSAEVDDIAAELERGIAEAMAATGASPAAVEVREPEVAEALTERLRRAGLPIPARAAPLAEVEEAMAALNQSMGGRARAVVPCMPETWAGWGQPDAWVAEVFRCSAAYHRARPWRYFDDVPPIIAETPAGDTWYLSVLGSGGVEHGLAFYSELDDLDRLLDDSLDTPTGRILSLTFETGQHLSRAARKEIARARWEVAAADAYPTLLTFGTPAGGLRRKDADDLVAMLAAVTAWTEAVERDEKILDVGPWRHPETGVELELVGFETEPILPPIYLETGGAEGAGARPEAALARRPAKGPPEPRESEWLDRFVEHLTSEGLSAKTVALHTRNVEVFLDYLASWAGVPVASVHEFDLRMFLFDWYPRKVAASKTEASGIPASLRRFFDFLHRSGDISCPWASRILRDKKAFMERWQASPGGPWWNEDVIEWQHEHFDELERLVLTPSSEVPGVLTWGAAQGLAEALLHDELQRRWLLWRDEVIRSSRWFSDEVRAALREREARWLTSPHAAYDGRTPVQVIEAERRETARRREAEPPA